MFYFDFSDEFDAGSFDLRGRAVPVRYVGPIDFVYEGHHAKMHEFEVDQINLHYIGKKRIIGNRLLASLSGSPDPRAIVGARVGWLDQESGTLVHIGRAALRPESIAPPI